MALRYVIGDPTYWNALARAAAITGSVAADTLFPYTAAFDHDPSTIFKFSTTGATVSIKADLTQNTNPTLDSWLSGTPIGYTEVTSGTGAITQDSVTRYGGSGSSAKMNVGSGLAAYLYFDHTARAGGRLRVEARTIAGPTTPIWCSIQDLRTGKYYDGTTQTWGATVAHALVVTDANVFPLYGVNLQVDTFEAIQADTTTLRIFWGTYSTTDVWVDEIRVFPGIGFGGVFGHNVPPGVAVGFQYSPDDSAYITPAIGVARQPSFYKTFDVVFSRWWRFMFSGAMTVPLYGGELVLSDLATAVDSQAFGWTVEGDAPQLRHQTPAGHVTVFPLAQQPIRQLKLSFPVSSVAAYKALRDEWYARALGGAHPMIVVPDDGDADVAVYGRMTQAFRGRRTLNNVWDAGTITVEEAALPTVVT